MQAGAYYLKKGRIEVRKAERPKLESGEVLIEVAFAGVCGSDMHLYHGLMDRRVHTPHILGHEAAGTVVETASDVVSVQPGDPVVVRPIVPCFECPACRTGRTHLCHNFRLLGIDLPGCFQTMWKVPEYTLHRIHKEVPLRRAALVEPVAVACHAVNTIAEVKEGERIVVIGAGPIGILICLIAQHNGADVIVADISAERIAIARELGLRAVNPNELDIEKEVRDSTGGAGADAVFEVSSSAAGARLMSRLVRARGRIIVVAMFHTSPEVDLLQFFKQELRMFGSRVYEAKDFERAIELVRRNSLPFDRYITDVRPLSEAASVFQELEQRRDVMKILLRPS